MRLYAVTIFLSAFLLFLVQPLIGRAILPWFGGSAAVWTVCMLFFQLVLLLGYLYAHALMRFSVGPRQGTIHLVLLLLSLLALPILPREAWKPTGGDDPTGRILLLLLVTVGLPYFLLSTTGPLLQAWYAAHTRHTSATPYRLYALSNIGSLLALFAYPFLVEPLLPIRQQAHLWSLLYGLFVLCCGLLAWQQRRTQAGVQVFRDSGRPNARQYSLPHPKSKIQNPKS